MKNCRSAIILALFGIWFATTVKAQEYVSPAKSPQTGRSPGVKVKLISENGPTKTYAIIFAPGDEILSGLKEFAVKFNVKSAHFTAIGDVTAVKFGWFDRTKKMFKVIEIKTSAEVTSLIGDIAIDNNEPSVHAHINVATEDGTVHGGHLLEGFISPTLEVMMTVEPLTLNKVLDKEFEIKKIEN